MIISNLGCISHFCNFIVSWMTEIFLLVVRKSYLKQRLTVLKQTQIHGQKQNAYVGSSLIVHNLSFLSLWTIVYY